MIGSVPYVLTWVKPLLLGVLFCVCVWGGWVGKGVVGGVGVGNLKLC